MRCTSVRRFLFVFFLSPFPSGFFPPSCNDNIVPGYSVITSSRTHQNEHGWVLERRFVPLGVYIRRRPTLCPSDHQVFWSLLKTQEASQRFSGFVRQTTIYYIGHSFLTCYPSETFRDVSLSVHTVISGLKIFGRCTSRNYRQVSTSLLSVLVSFFVNGGRQREKGHRQGFPFPPGFLPSLDPFVSCDRTGPEKCGLPMTDRVYTHFMSSPPKLTRSNFHHHI